MIAKFKTACGAIQYRDVWERRHDYLIPLYKHKHKYSYSLDNTLSTEPVDVTERRFVWRGREPWPGPEQTIDVYEEEL